MDPYERTEAVIDYMETQLLDFDYSEISRICYCPLGLYPRLSLRNVYEWYRIEKGRKKLVVKLAKIDFVTFGNYKIVGKAIRTVNGLGGADADPRLLHALCKEKLGLVAAEVNRL